MLRRSSPAIALLAATIGAPSAWAGPPLESVVVEIDKRDLAPDIAAAAAPISRLIYINRCLGGCTVTPGPHDARANTTSIISSTRSLSPFAHSDEVFDAAVACLRDVYRPYDVEIVTDDPGTVPHHEAILAGTALELGIPPEQAQNIGGLAPALCEPLDNVISFSFANTVGPDPLDLCWTVAQESAHAFGLRNHVRDCSDPLTYIPNCGQKFFRDAGLQCGDFEDSECKCIGGQVQNSHRTLLSVFGAGQAVAPPVVTIDRPSAEQSVTGGFAIQFNVTHPRASRYVHVLINGTVYHSRAAWPIEMGNAPYLIAAPDLPDGYLNIKVIAIGELGEVGETEVRVLKGAPCTADGQCLDGQSCVEGGCAFPPADRALGDACDDGRQCLTGLCPAKGGQSFCSEFCNPADPYSCLVGFDCLAVDGNSGVCWPEDASTGGGCCQAAGSQPPFSTVLLFALVVLLTRRRRRGRPGAVA